MRDEADIQDDLWDRGYYDEPDDVDPSECEHLDWNGRSRWEVECMWCETKGLRVVNNADMTWGTWDEAIETVIVWSV
jgi:hypothetical protein